MSYISKSGPQISDAQVVSWRIHTLTGTTFLNSQPADVVWNRAHTSVKTPNWRQIRNSDKRKLPINPFTGYCHVRRDAGGSCSRQTLGFFQGRDVPVTITHLGAARTHWPVIYNGLGTRPGFGYEQSQSVTMAQNSALSRMKDMSFNAAQALAEHHQTANMLMNTVNRFATFALMMRRGKFSAAKQVLGGRAKTLLPKGLPRDLKEVPTKDVFGSLWLEYTYGWKPLLSDIYGAAESLANTYHSNRPTRVTGKGIMEGSLNSAYSQSGQTAAIKHQWTATTMLELEYEVLDSFIDMAKKHGLTDPLLLAWELMPYSFVIDWILPVGNYLSNLSAPHGLRFKRGWNTTKTLYHGKSVLASGQGDWRGTESFACYEEGVQISRSVMTSFPKPTLTLAPFMNTARWTSSLALLNQVFGRR